MTEHEAQNSVCPYSYADNRYHMCKASECPKWRWDNPQSACTLECVYRSYVQGCVPVFMPDLYSTLVKQCKDKHKVACSFDCPDRMGHCGA